MFSPNHPIVRAVARDPQLLERFWASVDRREPAAEACWEWQGAQSCGTYPVFRVRHRAVSAARIAWFAATGEFPLGGKLRHTCQNSRCVRPEHLEWELGRRAEQMLRATSGGYVPVGAVRSLVRGLEADAA